MSAKTQADDAREFEWVALSGLRDNTVTNTPIGIRREHVSSWALSRSPANTTVVHMLGGRAIHLNIPFKEFHAWVIGPSAQQDVARSRTATTSRKNMKP